MMDENAMPDNEHEQWELPKSKPFEIPPQTIYFASNATGLREARVRHENEGWWTTEKIIPEPKLIMPHLFSTLPLSAFPSLQLAMNNADDTPENRVAWQRETAPIWSAPPGFFGIPKDLHPPIFEAPPIPAQADGQVPHPGIEWDIPQNGFRDRWRVFEISKGLTITFSLVKGDYFLLDGSLYEDGDWDRGETITPETIDEIIAKLQHFKRVVFGEGE